MAEAWVSDCLWLLSNHAATSSSSKGMPSGVDSQQPKHFHQEE